MNAVRRKADAHLIENRLESLAIDPPADAKKWWPKYLYHFTEVTNAVEILKSGLLLSRKAACASGRLQHDSADDGVIAVTEDDVKDYCRLYFRPLTPTQYRNEGIRTQEDVESGPHCPVPVYLLFDAVEILTRYNTEFSFGNLAADKTRYSSAADFLRLPFDKIYHASSLYGYDNYDKRNIIYHRHAEVCVPEQLDVMDGSLKVIVCRSRAERTLLLNLLPPDVAERWRSQIRLLRNPADMFFRQWTFIEDAILTSESIRLRFNPDTTSPGPFELVIKVQNSTTGRIAVHRNDLFKANRELVLSLERIGNPWAYSVECYINGYKCYYDFASGDDETPF